MTTISNMIIPILVLLVIIYGILKKVNVYDVFLKGASEFLKDHTENGKFVENSIEFKFPTLAQ